MVPEAAHEFAVAMAALVVVPMMSIGEVGMLMRQAIVAVLVSVTCSGRCGF